MNNFPKQLPQQLFPLSFLLLLALTVALPLRSQTSVTEAYEQVLEATQLKGQQALPLLQGAQTFCQTQACPDSLQAKLYHRLGVAYFQAAIDDDLALVFVDSARLFYQAYLSPDHPLIANQWYNLAVIERILGRLDAASEHIDQALSLLERYPPMQATNRDSVAAKWYAEAAAIKFRLRDGATGLGLAEKATGFAQQQPTAKATLASLSVLMGNEYYALGNFSRARRSYQQAESAYRQLGESKRIDRAMALYSIGNTYSEEELVARALPYYRQALTIFEQINETSGWAGKNWANVTHNLAWNYIKTGALETARDYLEQERTILTARLQHERYPEFGNHYLLRAKFAVAQGDYALALREIDQALAILYPDLGSTDWINNIIGPLDYATEALTVRAEIFAGLGDLEASLQQYQQLDQLIREQRRKMGNNLSQYALSRSIKPAYEQAINYALQLNDAEQAYRYCAQNKAIVYQQSVQNSRALAEARLPQKVPKEEKKLREEIEVNQRNLYGAYQKQVPIDSLKRVLFDSQQAYQAFIKRLEKDHPDYFRLKYKEVSLPNLADVQSTLARQQLFVEYFVGQERIYAFVASRAQQKVYDFAYPPGLMDSINLYRELLGNGVEVDCEAQFIRVSHYLYRQLLAPILQDFPAEDFKRLLIVPDEQLNLLAFEALLERPIQQLNGAEAFLLERFAISYAFSSQMLLDAPRMTTNAPELFLGFGLEYDDFTMQYLEESGFGKSKEDKDALFPCGKADTSRYFGRLHHSDDEVAAIAELLDGRAVLNQKALKSTFLEDAAQHQILHLAMHGVFDLNYPLNSSLLFNYAEGEDLILRAAEIYGMELSADMVVLSACNTAYGALAAGEGPMSLARAFHHAGTKSTVASLWSVSDYATAHIMQLFYEELLKGEEKDLALRNAKLAYLGSSDYSSPTTRMPFYWAPAIVIGDTAPLDDASNRWWLWGLLAGLLFLFLLRQIVKK